MSVVLLHDRLIKLTRRSRRLNPLMYTILVFILPRLAGWLAARVITRWLARSCCCFVYDVSYPASFTTQYIYTSPSTIQPSGLLHRKRRRGGEDTIQALKLLFLSSSSYPCKVNLPQTLWQCSCVGKGYNLGLSSRSARVVLLHSRLAGSPPLLLLVCIFFAASRSSTISFFLNLKWISRKGLLKESLFLYKIIAVENYQPTNNILALQQDAIVALLSWGRVLFLDCHSFLSILPLFTSSIKPASQLASIFIDLSRQTPQNQPKPQREQNRRERRGRERKKSASSMAQISEQNCCGHTEKERFFQRSICFGWKPVSYLLLLLLQG